MNTHGARKIPRAEHVGSLLRPKAIRDAMAARQTVNAADPDPSGASLAFHQDQEAEFQRVADDCIREVVTRQEDIGLDAVTDGEFRRAFFLGSFDSAVSGFAPNDDPEDAVVFHNNEGQRYEVPARPMVVERLTKVANPLREEAAFMSQTASRPVKVTLQAGSAPTGFHNFKPGVSDRVYADMDEMLDDAVAITNELALEAIDAGADYVQFDYPLYTHVVDPAWREKWESWGYDLDEHLERMLRADRGVVANFPDHVRKGLHLCRGNLMGTWAAEGSLDSVAEELFSLPYDSFLVEWEETDRMGDFAPLKKVPPGKVVAVGVVSSKMPELEKEDDILRRLDEAARYIDMDQLALTPQCGFASTLEGNPLSEDDQWRKLELIARVADRVWPR